MRVATFNIQHGQPADGGAVRPDAVIEACRSLDADVLGLQEVDRMVSRSGGVDLPGRIAEALDCRLAWGTAARVDGGEYGNAVLVRGEVADHEVVRLHRRGRRERRVAVLVSCTVEEQTFTTAVVHLSIDNEEASDQLLDVLDTLRRRPRPWLLMGDFNMRPERLLPWVVAEGIRLLPTGPTWPARSPRYAIDHIGIADFVPGAVDVVKTPISDHRAVVAELLAVPLGARPLGGLRAR